MVTIPEMAVSIRSKQTGHVGSSVPYSAAKDVGATAEVTLGVREPTLEEGSEEEKGKRTGDRADVLNSTDFTKTKLHRSGS